MPILHPSPKANLSFSMPEATHDDVRDLLPSESLFDNLPPLQGAAVIYFAIVDLVAAVGLWLATPWGGVIWLFAALTQIATVFVLPGFFSMFPTAANCLDCDLFGADLESWPSRLNFLKAASFFAA
jgi:Family of unknown function (DUF6163)